jgi:hypothetical protein
LKLELTALLDDEILKTVPFLIRIYMNITIVFFSLFDDVLEICNIVCNKMDLSKAQSEVVIGNLLNIVEYQKQGIYIYITGALY